jgi:hypothetical protein
MLLRIPAAVKYRRADRHALVDLIIDSLLGLAGGRLGGRSDEIRMTKSLRDLKYRIG